MLTIETDSFYLITSDGHIWWWWYGMINRHSSNDLFFERAKYSQWNPSYADGEDATIAHRHHHHHPVHLDLATQRCDPHLMVSNLFRSDSNDEPQQISLFSPLTAADCNSLQPRAFISSNYSSTVQLMMITCKKKKTKVRKLGHMKCDRSPPPKKKQSFPREGWGSYHPSKMSTN